MSAIAITGAQPIGSNELEVALSSAPLAASPSEAGDVYNPATWSITRQDTGYRFTVLAVTLVDATHYAITTLEAFGPAVVPHILQSTTLLAADGVTLVTPPGRAVFPGVDNSAASLAITKGPVRDFMMDPVTHDWAVLDGDFGVVSGADAVPQGIDISINMWQGDNFMDNSRGIDYPGQIFVKNGDPLVQRALVREQIARVPDVTDVVGQQLQLDKTRTGSLAFAVRTVYSQTQAITGQVNQQ